MYKEELTHLKGLQCAFPVNHYQCTTVQDSPRGSPTMFQRIVQQDWGLLDISTR